MKPVPDAEPPAQPSTAPTPPPAAPPSAAAVFGDRLDLAERFVAHLATTGTTWGLIGPRETPRLWDRHVLNCAVMTELLPPETSVADIGSGAGLPGLVIAVRRPDVQVLLIEPLLRRVTWLQQVLDDLQLPNVRVVRARAEELHGTEQVAHVTARAVAPLDRLAAWGLPLLGPSGQLLALKGVSAADEVAQTAAAVRAAGGVGTEVLHVGAGVLADPVTVVRVTVGAGRRQLLTAGSESAEPARGAASGRRRARGPRRPAR